MDGVFLVYAPSTGSGRITSPTLRFEKQRGTTANVLLSIYIYI
jgi:hypothetical protein